MKSWYSIKAQGEDSAEIDIFDEIGYWGVRAADFIRDLRNLGKVQNIKVRVNSPGGDVFDGVAIHNALKRHEANVTVEVYGIAASIASIIAMAGNKVIMPENTWMFIHDPLAIVVGDADDMREMADALEKIAAGLIASYVAKTGKSEKDVKKWMSEDTWFTAAEALEAGLADEVSDPVKLAANANLTRFKNLPAPLKPFAEYTDRIDLVDLSADEVRAEAAEIVKICTQHDLPEMAAEFLAKGSRLEAVKNRFQHAGEIKKRCVAANMPERAKKFIIADMAPDEVSDALIKIQQACDAPEIDNKNGQQPAGRGQQAKKAIDYQEIYARRRNWNQKSGTSAAH